MNENRLPEPTPEQKKRIQEVCGPIVPLLGPKDVAVVLLDGGLMPNLLISPKSEMGNDKSSLSDMVRLVTLGQSVNMVTFRMFVEWLQARIEDPTQVFNPQDILKADIEKAVKDQGKGGFKPKIIKP